MKTVNDLLMSSYNQSDDTKLTVQLVVPLGFLRQNFDLLENFGLVAADGPGVSLTSAKAANENGAKRGRGRPRSNGAAGKLAMRSVAGDSKSTGKRRKKASPKVTLDAVLSAIKAKHNTPKDIAAVLKADDRLVHKALSRYAKAGIVKRISTGTYAIPKN